MKMTSGHAATPAAASTVFPFEKLPEELRIKVLRYVLPLPGILPRSPRAPPNSTLTFDQDEDWTQDENGAFWEYLDNLEIPVNSNNAGVLLPLILVNNRLAELASATFTDNVPMIINITPTCLHFLETLNSLLWEFPTYKSFLYIQHFREMRTFELNLDFDEIWWSDWFEEKLDPEEHIWWARPKEWLRTTCDLLAANNNIRQLTVRLPCLCALETPELVSQAEKIMLNLLSPLQRVCTANPLRFLWQHKHQSIDHEMPSQQLQSSFGEQCMAEDLVKKLQEKLGQLTGEGLNHPEGTWKRIKTMRRTRPSDDFDTSSISTIGDRLEKLHKRLEEWERSATLDASDHHNPSNKAFDKSAYKAVQTILDFRKRFGAPEVRQTTLGDYGFTGAKAIAFPRVNQTVLDVFGFTVSKRHAARAKGQKALEDVGIEKAKRDGN